MCVKHEDQEYDIIKSDKSYDLFLSNIDPIKSAITRIREPSIQAAQDFKNSSIDIVLLMLHMNDWQWININYLTILVILCSLAILKIT